MTNLEVVEMLIKLLALPEGQMWVSIDDMKKLAEKIDGPKK